VRVLRGLFFIKTPARFKILRTNPPGPNKPGVRHLRVSRVLLSLSLAHFVLLSKDAEEPRRVDAV